MATATALDLTDPKLYINRQLSWLDFNERVLAQARESRHPLLERIRFISISETNLDEFFMIRVAGLQKQIATERPNQVPDGMTPEEQLSEIRWRVERFFGEQRRILREELLPELEAAGIHLVQYGDLDHEEREDLCSQLGAEILPILTPLAIDTAHPFPHISNLSLNLLVVIRDDGREVLARVKVPNNLPRFLPVNGGADALPAPGQHHPVRLVRIEEVIAANLDELFPGHEVEQSYVFQVTRDADLDIQEDEAADLLQAIEDELDQRRFGESVRLVVTADMPERMRTWLAGHLGVGRGSIYAVPEPIGLAQLNELTHLDRPDLLYPPLTPRLPQESATDKAGILSQIAQGDMLLYHPYDSFVPVVDFVRTALDPEVLAVKQTLYRVGSNSPVVEALLDARDEDTQVAVLVELKARFDEEPNIVWARQLEAKGVHVSYGVVGLKTHAKLCMVVRREEAGLHRYAHLGTGNYNPSSARVYTDFSYFTDDPAIMEDVSDLFNYLTGYSRQEEYGKLLVAPVTLRKQLLKLIQEQRDLAVSGLPARITFKLNHLTDQRIITALYGASQAGVPVDLIVRTTCCLLPGVPGVSENIRVVTLVGRFLEHARVYSFGEGDGNRVYLGSADLMERNLDGRVETLFPLREEHHRQRVRRIMDLQLADTVNAWELGRDGCYTRITPAEGEEPLDSQALLLREASGKRVSKPTRA
ncbi:MAG: polyphosphate kinase 1 [Chloroflexota bacterium]|nr:polyphosphate kinase 1 [Chloroflexota bacterium]